MKRISHIFLDVDGVLANFTSAALRVHGAESMLDRWPVGERDLPKVIGISRTQYWKKIDSLGSSFWENLEPYPWFSELIEYVDSVAPFSLLTAAALSPDCARGKVEWIGKHFPKKDGKRFMNFLIGGQKELLAAPHRILIDDAERFVEAFEAAGGGGILFPQIWNKHHAINNPVEFVREQVEAYRQSERLS